MNAKRRRAKLNPEECAKRCPLLAVIAFGETFPKELLMAHQAKAFFSH